MSHAELLRWFIIGVVGISILAYVLSLIWKDWFNKQVYHFRGVWYLLSIITIGGYVYQNTIDYSKWKDFIIVISVFIYIDLVIFTRPKIKKIWGAEFNPDEVTQVGNQFEEHIIAIREKSKVYGDLIGRIDKTALKSLEWHTVQEYMDSLKLFLMEYTDKCHQEIWVVRNINHTVITTEARTIGVDLQPEHLVNLDDDTVAQISDSVCLVPSKVIHPIVIIVKQKEGLLQDIDFSNIKNLTTVHSFCQM
ncbi:type II toxin-antitoxin system SpoIISA family toxin (plasmid) [Aneurinibacillus sp. Ricciae_BoGa-3]|uniref:type II toxin-antitoxin system SpoIISA family toxin n=1 Tax=Aneurinibacillus sp. Ricciae_BoGa-3 TaxID=3022697 RepID=UPI0023422D78|nr:type II toxin-antitoxin system SpoIISA family toxin [Aneurinibacillus sp. Ricciae_BoGa-3]WCK57409.1 type II toxin-antitoxin system SpoIISA family toxin [Aneurinibacillus sp. Ricciae_BoGa-3]